MTSNPTPPSPLFLSEDLLYLGPMPPDRPDSLAWASISQANPPPQHERLALISSWLSAQFPAPAERESFLDLLKPGAEDIDGQMVATFNEVRQALKEINEATLELRHDEIGPQMLRELRLLWEQVVEAFLPKPMQAESRSRLMALEIRQDGSPAAGISIEGGAQDGSKGSMQFTC